MGEEVSLSPREIMAKMKAKESENKNQLKFTASLGTSQNHSSEASLKNSKSLPNDKTQKNFVLSTHNLSTPVNSTPSYNRFGIKTSTNVPTISTTASLPATTMTTSAKPSGNTIFLIDNNEATSSASKTLNNNADDDSLNSTTSQGNLSVKNPSWGRSGRANIPLNLEANKKSSVGSIKDIASEQNAEVTRKYGSDGYYKGSGANVEIKSRDSCMGPKISPAQFPPVPESTKPIAYELIQFEKPKWSPSKRKPKQPPSVNLDLYEELYDDVICNR